MDSLIAAAARALAAGDTLGALKRVSLREDAPALALRGTAMAQLGDLARARELLRRAALAFGPRETRARARCVVAEAEVALAMRDLSGSVRRLSAAADTLDSCADHGNAAQARLIAIRRQLLLGHLDAATSALAQIHTPALPLALRAMAERIAAELALRSLRTSAARAALRRATAAAKRAGIASLAAEIAEIRTALEQPAARRLRADHAQTLRLDEVEVLFASDALVIDGCRRTVRAGPVMHSLARRPILFALAQALATAWPGDETRDALIAHAFRTRRPDETHRARLRVELGRLRRLIAPLARIESTSRGFALVPQGGREVAVLLPPIEGDQSALLALLSDGAAWSTSALALALGASQRGVQRALAALHAGGRVRWIGRSRTRRWLARPLTGFTTILLLPAALPPG